MTGGTHHNGEPELKKTHVVSVSMERLTTEGYLWGATHKPHPSEERSAISTSALVAALYDVAGQERAGRALARVSDMCELSASPIGKDFEAPLAERRGRHHITAGGASHFAFEAFKVQLHDAGLDAYMRTAYPEDEARDLVLDAARGYAPLADSRSGAVSVTHYAPTAGAKWETGRGLNGIRNPTTGSATFAFHDATAQGKNLSLLVGATFLEMFLHYSTRSALSWGETFVSDFVLHTTDRGEFTVSAPSYGANRPGAHAVLVKGSLCQGNPAKVKASYIGGDGTHNDACAFKGIRSAVLRYVS